MKNPWHRLAMEVDAVRSPGRFNPNVAVDKLTNGQHIVVSIIIVAISVDLGLDIQVKYQGAESEVAVTGGSGPIDE